MTDDRFNSIGGGNRYRPNEDRYGMYPSRRPVMPPPRYSPSRYPINDNSISGDMGSRYFPERPDDGRYYPTTVTGTRYPTSDNRFPVGNERNPIFILKYGNRFGSSSGMGSGSGMSSGSGIKTTI